MAGGLKLQATDWAIDFPFKSLFGFSECMVRVTPFRWTVFFPRKECWPLKVKVRTGIPPLLHLETQESHTAGWCFHQWSNMCWFPFPKMGDNSCRLKMFDYRLNQQLCNWNVGEILNIIYRGPSKFMNPFFTGLWFGTFFIFPSIGNVIIPTDFHIFQRGRSTTNEFTMLEMMFSHIISRCPSFWIYDWGIVMQGYLSLQRCKSGHVWLVKRRCTRWIWPLLLDLERSKNQLIAVGDGYWMAILGCLGLQGFGSWPNGIRHCQIWWFIIFFLINLWPFRLGIPHFQARPRFFNQAKAGNLWILNTQQTGPTGWWFFRFLTVWIIM